MSTYAQRITWEPARRKAFLTAPIRGGKYFSARTCKGCDDMHPARYIESDLCVLCAKTHSLTQRETA